MQRNILVFTGSGDGDDPKYIQASHDTGQLIAENRDRLVYGGGSPGCMGALASGCMSHGGAVTGIIPDFIFGKEQPMTSLRKPPHKLIVTNSMSERKDKMFELAHVVVTLPGGYGTMDELFEGLTNSKLVEWRGSVMRPNILVNIDGYWDPLISLIDNTIVSKKFGPQLPNRFVVNRVDEIYPQLNAAMGQNIHNFKRA